MIGAHSNYMWKIVQAITPGKSHIKNNMPCQDRTFALEKNGVTTITLADGAGSASLSHIGAEVATFTLANYFCDNFEELFSEDIAGNVGEEIITIINDELYLKAKEIGCEINDLASTLLGVAVKNHKYIVFHLGDGVIGYYQNNRINVASSPDNGEFANTTVFTTSNKAQHYIRLLKGNLTNIEGFILFSDGPEKIFFNHQQKIISSSLNNLFEDLKDKPLSVVEKDLVETLEELKKATYDDCSIIAMVKIPNMNGISETVDYKCHSSEDLESNKKSLEKDNQSEKKIHVVREIDKNGYIKESNFFQWPAFLIFAFLIVIIVLFIVL